MHLSDGRERCCICFNAFEVNDLADAPHGGKVDICQACDRREKKIAADRWCQRSTPHRKHSICEGWPRG